MNPELRILLVEDSIDDADLLLLHLSGSGLRCILRREEDARGFLDALAEGGWDLVLSDFQLPETDGLEILRLLRDWDPDLPFILLSGVLDEGAAVEAMRRGANDFLLKGNLSRLVPAIERELRDHEIRRKRRADKAELTLLHTAIGQTPDMVVITDPAGAIVYANAAAEITSGYGRAELIGQNPRLFKSDRHDAAFFQAMWDSLLRGETWHGRIVNVRKDGSRWDSESVISPVFDAAGRLQNYLCTARDVTHERELEIQLEQNQRLETIGVLTSGVAHDFNNILMPVVGHAELALARPSGDPRIHKDLRAILASAGRAADLVRQILSFSRREAQEPAALELHPLLAESLKLLRATVPTSVSFQLDLDAHGRWVAGDPTRLHQVIVNLCVNAAHAMRGRAGRLTVKLRPRHLPVTPCSMGVTLPAGGYLQMDVGDTGRGILPEHLDKIFLPFFTTKPAKEGTGLGLSVTHGIISAMGGGIQVSSRPGEGSIFTVFLPEAGSPGTGATAAQDEEVRGSARVLLVDDEEILLHALSDGLASLGFSVTAFTRPADALEAFCSSPGAFDILLTDQQMPDVLGTQLAEALWTLQPGFPVIIITGSMQVREELERGPDRFRAILAKPLPVSEIAKAVLSSLAALKVPP